MSTIAAPRLGGKRMKFIGWVKAFHGGIDAMLDATDVATVPARLRSMKATPPQRRLPPLHSLLAFDAAARLGSFAGAAVALSITASAVSHRIRVLETRLRLRLFDRGHQRIVLTDAGERYWIKVRHALDALEEAGTSLVTPHRNALRIQTPPALGATWLSEQLIRYQEREGAFDFMLKGAYSITDLRTDAVDIAIRYSEDDWTGLVHRPLLAQTIFPVASPLLITRLGGLKNPIDLRGAPLLRHPQLAWSTWFRAAGIEIDEPVSGPTFDDAFMMLEAAVRGAGIALVVSTVYEHSRFADALVSLFEVRAPDQSYHMVLSRAGREKPWVRAFASWLLRRARGDASFEPV